MLERSDLTDVPADAELKAAAGAAGTVPSCPADGATRDDRTGGAVTWDSPGRDTDEAPLSSHALLHR